jgi:hypothetical protein
LDQPSCKKGNTIDTRERQQITRYASEALTARKYALLTKKPKELSRVSLN